MDFQNQQPGSPQANPRPYGETMYQTPQPGYPAVGGPDVHIQIVAIVRIIWGALMIPVALGLFAMTGAIAVSVGSSGDAGAAHAGGMFAMVGVIMAWFCILAGLPNILIGVYLLRRKEWARIVCMILGALDLPNFPVGTAIGGYTLWALLRPEAVQEFHS